LSHPGMFKTR